MIPEKERYENLEKFTPAVTGKYDIPVIEADEATFSDFIGFNYANTAKDRADKAVHFFLDDYQFLRVWNRPRDYIKLLSDFCLCAFARFFALYRFPRCNADIQPLP